MSHHKSCDRYLFIYLKRKKERKKERKSKIFT